MKFQLRMIYALKIRNFFELNETFAAQSLAVIKELGLDESKVQSTNIQLIRLHVL